MALFISSLEEHSYTCFARARWRAPHRYSPANRPSVYTLVDLEIDDHLGVNGSLPSTIFNRVIIEAKYQSAPAWSSTLHKSRMEYPHSRTSSTSVVSFPLPAKSLPPPTGTSMVLL
ncbi:hypothetical protein BHE74_00015148, partial [Ensete ventricosum]